MCKLVRNRARNRTSVNAPLWIIYLGDILHNIVRDIAGVIAPCLLTLANRNDPICVASPKVDKASTIHVAVTSIIAGVIVLTFANGNMALWLVYIGKVCWQNCWRF
jgi:hypothetical protein